MPAVLTFNTIAVSDRFGDHFPSFKWRLDWVVGREIDQILLRPVLKDLIKGDGQRRSGTGGNGSGGVLPRGLGEWFNHPRK